MKLEQLAKIKSGLKQQREQVELHAMVEAKKSAQVAKEARAFLEAVGAVKPLKASPRAVFKPTPPSAQALQTQKDEQAALGESLSDEFDAESLLETDDELSYARQGLAKDVLRKLRRGQWVIQDELDLHGARADEARELLAGFLSHAHKSGVRCVRVIHGKGLGSPGKIPVLKNKVRNWLVQKENVLAFCQAKAADGGSGALVVLLKST